MLKDYIWDRIASTEKHIVFYGTGDGADKIAQKVESLGKQVSGYFVSDDFYRSGKMFRGKEILTLSKAEKLYGAFLCLVAFGSRLENVLNNIEKVRLSHETLIPDMPLCGDVLFDETFYESNRTKHEKVLELLSDDYSRRTLDDIIKFRLTGNPDYLFDCQCTDSEYRNILDKKYTAYADLGAYTGDTLRRAIDDYPSIRLAVCMEPSEKSFKKLAEYTNTFFEPDTIIVNAAAWDKEETGHFIDSGGRGSKIVNQNIKPLSGSKNRDVEYLPLDHVCDIKNEQLLIKYDVEGAEIKALKGSKETILNNNTDLEVSVYHRSEDIFDIPLYVHDLLPEHKLFIRKLSGVPAWDILLYAVGK